MHPLQPPSCCAGLRPTLINGWRQGLPLHTSPFVEMAARCGATPRELLRTCAQLQRDGALQPLQARWGEALPRERWRLFFDRANEALVHAIARLPGCARIERCTGESDPTWLWADMETLDAASLRTQLGSLLTQPQACMRLRSGEAPASGPSCDPQLAALLEKGLPLSAKPYSACARQLGRTERSLLATLMNWVRASELQGLVLAPAPPREPRQGWIALWQHATALVEAQSLPGLERLWLRPPEHGDWPWALSAVLGGATPPARLPGDARCLRVRIQQPREAALLFQGAG